VTSKTHPTELVVVALTLNFIAFFAAAVWFYWHNSIYVATYPFNSFLPAPVTRFGDFFGMGDLWSREKFFGIGYGMSYFPATYLPVDLSVRFFPWPWGAAFAALLSGMGLLLFGTLKIERSAQVPWARCLLVVIVLLTSYPTVFLIHTGNIELWVIGSIVIGLWLSLSEKHLLAGIWLGIAVSMKLTPIVFIVAFIYRRKVASIIKCSLGLVIGVAMSTALPLILYSGGLRDGIGVFARLRESQRMYLELMVWGGAGTHFGHSLLNGINALFGQYVRQRTWWIPVLMVGCLIFVALFFLQARLKTSLGEVLITCAVGICLLAPTSTDYKLTAFFPGLIVLFTEVPAARSYFLTIMSCLVIAPKPYFRTSVCDYCTSSVWLTPLLMVVLLIGVVVFNVSTFLRLKHQSVALSAR